MKAWEDLSGAVKTYLVIAVLLIGVVLAVRSCSGPESTAEPPPRGYAAE